jgi:serine/threonine protein kinase
MGVVYRAEDVILRRQVAVKTLPRLSADAAERLLDEARAMAALSHTHIAVLYGAEQWRGTPVLMVEYLEGGTLAERLRGGRLPIDMALELGRALAEGLVYMHATNRFHGDIKPSNIGFTINGTVKFMDFGVSRTMQGDGHAGHLVGGTLTYLSPDVLDGAPTGAESDVWALSVTLFQMLTGHHPFTRGNNPVSLIRAGIDQQEVRALLPPPLADFFVDSLGTSSEARPASAPALLERLAGVQNRLAARSHV